VVSGDVNGALAGSSVDGSSVFGLGWDGGGMTADLTRGYRVECLLCIPISKKKYLKYTFLKKNI
jgi:hypothetical protein